MDAKRGLRVRKIVGRGLSGDDALADLPAPPRKVRPAGEAGAIPELAVILMVEEMNLLLDGGQDLRVLREIGVERRGSGAARADDKEMRERRPPQQLFRAPPAEGDCAAEGPRRGPAIAHADCPTQREITTRRSDNKAAGAKGSRSSAPPPPPPRAPTA